MNCFRLQTSWGLGLHLFIFYFSVVYPVADLCLACTGHVLSTWLIGMNHALCSRPSGTKDPVLVSMALKIVLIWASWENSAGSGENRNWEYEVLWEGRSNRAWDIPQKLPEKMLSSKSLGVVSPHSLQICLHLTEPQCQTQAVWHPLFSPAADISRVFIHNVGSRSFLKQICLNMSLCPWHYL